MQRQEPNSPTPYEVLGGDAKVRELVERFYDLMELEPNYRLLRDAQGSSEERDQWMACMMQAMEETEVPQELRQALGAALQNTADWMRNK